MSENENETREQKVVSRREFLKIAGIAGASIGAMGGLGGLLAACGGDEPTTTTAATTATTAAPSTDSTAAGESTTTTVAASAEEGRLVKIGALSPITGSLASFGGPDKWIVQTISNTVKDGIICGDGKLHKIQIINMDTQSNVDRCAQVTGDLIFNDKVDFVLASSSPDTVNPAAEQCEANGVPLLANFVPWQPFYFGRGATPDTPFKWTWMYHFGVEDAAEMRIKSWDQVQTNKKVAILFPNDADGVAWAKEDSGIPFYLKKGGYEIVAFPELYAPPSEDYTVQIAEFKKSGAEILMGQQIAPDFNAFWQQCYQQDFKPKILSVAKALLFHQTIQAVGDIGVGASDHNVWHPTYPYKSSLTGQTCQELADQWTAETGEQWTQPLGQYGKYEWAIDVLKRVTDLDNKELFPEVIAQTKFEGINGPVDFTQPVKLGTSRPVPNVCKIKIAHGQWVKLPEGSKYKYDEILTAAQDEKTPIGKPFELMQYS